MLVAAVVVAGQHGQVIRETAQFLQAVPVFTGIAAEQVGAAGAAFAQEQEVAGEERVLAEQRHAVLGVAGGVQHAQGDVAADHAVVLAQPLGRRAHRTLVMHRVRHAGLFGQQRAGRDVVGMRVRVEHAHEVQVVLAERGRVEVDVIDDGVDKHRLTRPLASDEPGLARTRVEREQEHGSVASGGGGENRRERA